jgi:D-3-phosphoglycerate dehydrogenase
LSKGLRIAWSPSSFCQVDDGPIQLLERLGVDVVPNPFGRRLTAEEAIQHVHDVDGLIAGVEPLGRDVLSSTQRLRAIARVGIGTDNVDLAAAKELGIRVSNTPDAPADAVAELTLGAMLSLVRGLDATNRAMHAGGWPKVIHRGLRGTTVLIVGFGRIGRAVYRLLQAFGPEVLVADPAVDAADHPGVSVVPLADGLSRAQIVSLHAGGRETILRADELALMPVDSFLLNGARGELVDEDALIGALESGHLAGAWFDVFWEEPYHGRLTELEQVILTPHVGTYTASCRREMEMQATRNLLADLGIAMRDDS